MTDRVLRALLIANWQYPRDPEQLPLLNGPRSDLPLLQQALTHPHTGLHDRNAVMVLANRTRAAIMQRLEDFLGQASGNEQLLVYYSGHGRLNLEDQLYLCARDTDTERLVSSAIAARDLSQMIANSPARAKVVILDCCYSGSFKSGPTHPRRLAGEGRFVLTSSRRAQLTGDSTGPTEPSPFTRNLAEALCGAAVDSDGDGFISIDDVYRYVRDRMREQSGSTPQRSFDHAVGELAMARTLETHLPRTRPAPTAPPTSQSLAVRPRTAAISRPPVAAAPPAAAGLDATALPTTLATAQALERRGDVRGARRAYQRIIDAVPGDWAAIAAHQLAQLLSERGDIAGATEAYQLVIADQHPEWAPRAACQLGQLLTAQGELPAAQEAYERVVDCGHPQWSPRAATELADLLVEQGELASARGLYQQAMDSGHPEWAPRAAVGLGDILIQGAEIGLARAVYRRAVLSGHPEWAARAEGPLRTLVGAGPASVAGLVSTLTDARPEIRDAYLAWGWSPTWSSSDGCDEVRWRSAEALAVIGDERAVGALTRALDDHQRGIRMAAAAALGTRGAAAAVAPLVTLLADDDPDLRWSAIDALAAIGPPAVPALLEALASSAPTGTGAVAALSGMRTSVIPALSAALRSDRQSVRLGAAEALSRHAPAGLPPLFEALRDGDDGVRETAAYGLAAIGPASVDGLINCLSASEPPLRRAAARVLGQVTSRQALHALERMLGDTDAACREAAADALAAHGADALPAVLRALRDPREPTRAAGFHAAVAIGGAGVVDLRRLTGAPPPVGPLAVAALNHIATPAALLHLSEIGQLSEAGYPSQT